MSYSSDSLCESIKYFINNDLSSFLRGYLAAYSKRTAALDKLADQAARLADAAEVANKKFEE